MSNKRREKRVVLMLVILTILGFELLWLGPPLLRNRADRDASLVDGVSTPRTPTTLAKAPPTRVGAKPPPLSSPPPPRIVPEIGAPISTAAQSTAAPLLPPLPTPSVELSPLHMPSAESSPLALTPSAQLAKVVAAEGQLRSGWFEAVLDLGGGSRSASTLRFDFGGPGRAPRLHTITTYQGPSGSRTMEHITIGTESWQRHADGAWVRLGEQEGVRGRLHAYLPDARSVSRADLELGSTLSTLRWHDRSGNRAVELGLDPTTGIPRELRQTRQADGVVLTVTYRGWNTPVDIVPPSGG